MNDQFRQNKLNNLRAHLVEIDATVEVMRNAIIELGGSYAYEFGIAIGTLTSLRIKVVEEIQKLEEQS